MKKIYLIIKYYFLSSCLVYEEPDIFETYIFSLQWESFDIRSFHHLIRIYVSIK